MRSLWMWTDFSKPNINNEKLVLITKIGHYCCTKINIKYFKSYFWGKGGYFPLTCLRCRTSLTPCWNLLRAGARAIWWQWPVMKKHSVGNLGDWNFPTATKMKNRVIIIIIYLSRSLAGDSAEKYMYMYVMIQRYTHPQWLVSVPVNSAI